jgi:hypothetical protein
LGRVTTLSQLAGLPLARPAGLIEDRIVLRYDEPSPVSLGVHRLDLELATSDLAGGDRHRIGTFVSRTVDIFEFQGRTAVRALLFSGRTAVAADTDEIFVGLPFDSYEVRAYRSDGTLSRIIRRTFDPVAVADRDIESLVDRRLAQLEGEWSEAEVRNAFRELKRADVMPAFGVPEWPGPERAGPPMLVDDAENLWVFEYYRPGEYANEWTVFDPEGAWLTRAELPDRFIPTHIGEDFVLGHWIDDLGLPHIRLYELEK